jgi:hypothetical protein
MQLDKSCQGERENSGVIENYCTSGRGANQFVAHQSKQSDSMGALERISLRVGVIQLRHPY